MVEKWFSGEPGSYGYSVIWKVFSNWNKPIYSVRNQHKISGAGRKILRMWFHLVLSTLKSSLCYSVQRERFGQETRQKWIKNEEFGMEISPNQLYPFLTHATHFLRNVRNFSDVKCSLGHICPGRKTGPYWWQHPFIYINALHWKIEKIRSIHRQTICPVIKNPVSNYSKLITMVINHSYRFVSRCHCGIFFFFQS